MNQELEDMVKRPKYTIAYIALLSAGIILATYSLVVDSTYSEHEMLWYASLAVFITTMTIGMGVESRKDTSILTMVALVGSIVCMVLVTFSVGL